MLKKLLIQRYYHFLVLIYIQIILLFVYIPILIYWGLPISYMSIVGNIIFLPFLTIFLSLSTLFLFTELFQIPNSLLSSIINHFVENWFKLLKYGSRDWLIGFAYPGIIPIISILLVGVALYVYTQKFRLEYKILWLFGTITIFCLALKLFTPVPDKITLEYQRKKMEIYNNRQHLTLIIPRTRLHQTGFISWFFYEAQPLLFTTFGSAYIDTIIFINPTSYGKKILLANQPFIGYKKLITTALDKRKRMSRLYIQTFMC